ncbi:hypothetical protein [Rhodococcus qingshengii]|uniref:hypothetical protein n=1 Tax=Rhodococcus qingshengii TaxID=334542 RepID=UPI00237CE2B6|nr:hypothetical protein [Rhodococcus qingshengii]WCT06230.1 hypothetical protein PI247_31605 [Rhodococcus qingshengii]
MTENDVPRKRSAVEASLYQTTKHTRVITDADLAAVVEGLTGVPVPEVDRPRIDFAFPAQGDPDVFN